MLRTSAVLVLWLLSTAWIFSQSPDNGIGLLPDGSFKVPPSRLDQWATDRTTDRNSVRYLLNDRQDYEKEAANDRNTIVDLRQKNVELSGQNRMLTADNGAKDIVIMNLTSEINDFAGKAVWATVGKVGTVVVVVAVIVVAVVVIKASVAP